MIYKLFGAVPNNATTDSIASLDIQEDGFITAVAMYIDPSTLDAVDDEVRCEVSFMSSNTFTVNDTRGSIFQHGVSQQFLTSGGGMGSLNASISGLLVPVEGGERVHLHSLSVLGGSGSSVTVYLYVEDSQDTKQRPKRRLR